MSRNRPYNVPCQRRGCDQTFVPTRTRIAYCSDTCQAEARRVYLRDHASRKYVPVPVESKGAPRPIETRLHRRALRLQSVLDKHRKE